MSNFTKVEVPTIKKTKVSIKPFIKPNVDLGGLEKYSANIHDGVFHTEQLACLEQHGVQRFVTGLNEFAPEIKMIKDEALREAKIKEIRKNVSILEKEMASNIVDPEDKDFWNKLVLLKPSNEAFWSKIDIRLGSLELFLDLEGNPHDRINYFAIKAGGYSSIAPSYKHALEMHNPPKWYLDSDNEVAEMHTSKKKIKNKALGLLNEIYDEDRVHLLFLVKNLDSHPGKFNHRTSKDYIYETLDGFINGKNYINDYVKASEKFIEYAEKEKSDLKMRALVLDLIESKEILTKKDGLYFKDGLIDLGRTVDDVILFFKDDKNGEVYIEASKKAEHLWDK
jgi:hypothetical protein